MDVCFWLQYFDDALEYCRLAPIFYAIKLRVVYFALNRAGKLLSDSYQECRKYRTILLLMSTIRVNKKACLQYTPPKQNYSIIKQWFRPWKSVSFSNYYKGVVDMQLLSTQVSIAWFDNNNFESRKSGVES